MFCFIQGEHSNKNYSDCIVLCTNPNTHVGMVMCMAALSVNGVAGGARIVQSMTYCPTKKRQSRRTK